MERKRVKSKRQVSLLLDGSNSETLEKNFPSDPSLDDGKTTDRGLSENLPPTGPPTSSDCSTRNWRSLASQNLLWHNLFKKRWGKSSAEFYGPVGTKSWKDVYEVQDRCDRVGLGLKIIREGFDYYIVHQGEIQRHLGSIIGNKEEKASRSIWPVAEEPAEGDEPNLGLVDKILFFVGDLEVAMCNTKRSRLL